MSVDEPAAAGRLGPLGPVERLWRPGRLRRPGYGRTLGLIVTLGAVLRLALLARQPLGVDEDFTAAVVVRPLGDMLGVVSRDSAPPFFYMAEWLVAQFNHGPAALRIVPVVAGIALIPLLASLARRVAGDAAGLWAAVFVAIVPATVLASENARMYSMAGALVVAAILLAWRAAELSPEPAAGPAANPAANRAAGRPGLRRWLAYGVVAAAAVWTDYFAVIALAGLLIALAWLRPGRRALIAAGLATAVAFASLLPWLVFAHAQFEHGGQAFWIPPLSFSSVAGTFGQLFAGPPVDAGVPGREILIGLQVIAAGAGLVALASAPAARLGHAHGRAAGFLLLACSGVIALAALSVWRPLLEARYAGVMWLPLFALAGSGLAAMPRRFAVGLVVALAVSSLALGVAKTHPQTADLLPEIESRAGAHDLVAADASHFFSLLDAGGPGIAGRLHVLAASDPPWFFGTAAYPAGAVIHAAPDDVTAAGGAIYYVSDPGTAPPPLPAGYRAAERRCVVQACLTVFEPAG
jgi:4-amino-4-deoxy-L-arabinose transferase-like glycosyltransferase